MECNRRSSSGMTLVELLTVLGIVLLITTMTFTTAKDEYEQFKLQAMVREAQSIVNLMSINREYETGMDLESMHIATTDNMIRDITGEPAFSPRFSAIEMTVDYEGDVIEPYGVQADGIRASGETVGTILTFYSQQTDPLVSLYLSSPRASYIAWKGEGASHGD